MNPADMYAVLESDDPTACDAVLLMQHPQPSHNVDASTSLRNSVSAAAKANMALSAQLSTLRGDVLDLQVSLRDRRRDLADNIARAGSAAITTLCDPAKVRQRCAEAARAEDVASEKLVADAVAGRVAVGVFLRQYTATRCLFHRLTMVQESE